MPGEVKRQTIKQAKKSFKARGQPALSDRELKQLEPARELEQRAWKAKEQEKRRAESNRKRADKEKEERERAQLGSQRRCDRFGYQSSQFHLGKFFTIGGEDAAKIGGKEAPTTLEKANEHDMASGTELGAESGDDTSEEDFFGDDIDDCIILDALEQSTTPKEGQESVDSGSKPIIPSPSPSVVVAVRRGPTEQNIAAPAISASPAVAPVFQQDILGPQTDKPAHSIDPVDEDLGGFWDELDSSTQIARDLGTPQLRKGPPSRSSSFGMDDMDLTAEDLERLDPPKPAPQVKDDRMLMPPPLLPPQHALRAPGYARPSKANSRSTTSQSQAVEPLPGDRWRPCSIKHGFTISELESWVDDDIVLTQADPG